MQEDEEGGSCNGALVEEAAQQAGRTPSIWGETRAGTWVRTASGGRGRRSRGARFDAKPARSRATQNSSWASAANHTAASRVEDAAIEGTPLADGDREVRGSIAEVVEHCRREVREAAGHR